MNHREAETRAFWSLSVNLRNLVKSNAPYAEVQQELNEIEAYGHHAETPLIRNLAWALICETSRIYTRQIVSSVSALFLFAFYGHALSIMRSLECGWLA